MQNWHRAANVKMTEQVRQFQRMKEELQRIKAELRAGGAPLVTLADDDCDREEKEEMTMSIYNIGLYIRTVTNTAKNEEDYDQFFYILVPSFVPFSAVCDPFDILAGFFFFGMFDRRSNKEGEEASLKFLKFFVNDLN